MIEKGYFFIELDSGAALDVGSLTVQEWRDVLKRAERIMIAKQTKNEKIAFVAGFLNFVMEKQAMKHGFKDQH